MDSCGVASRRLEYADGHDRTAYVFVGDDGPDQLLLSLRDNARSAHIVPVQAERERL